MIEANPRASRTVPFVSKATGLPLAKLACRVMLGERLADMDLPEDPCGDHVSVKEAVLPFDRFAGADALLGPEMRSTGEVMGIAPDFPAAFAKAQAAAGARLPAVGHRVPHRDRLRQGGDRRRWPRSCTTSASRSPRPAGRRARSRRMGIPVERLNKLGEGSPHVVDKIEGGDVVLVINTPTGTAARADGYEIRRAAIARGIPCITTIAGGMAAARAIAAARQGGPSEALAPGDQLLRHRARPPDRQRLGHLRRDRRAAGVRRRAARRLPVRRVRLQDRHPRAARRATRRRGCGSSARDDQLDRAARTRASTGYLAEDLPQLAALPVPLIVNVMGSSAEDVGRSCRRSPSATRSPRSSSTSPARTSGPGC